MASLTDDDEMHSPVSVWEKERRNAHTAVLRYLRRSLAHAYYFLLSLNKH